MGCSPELKLLYRDRIQQHESAGSVASLSIVAYEDDIGGKGRLVVMAQDSAQPPIVSFMITSTNPGEFEPSYLQDSAGHRIQFGPPSDSRFTTALTDRHVIGAIDLNWDDFSRVAKDDSLSIVSSSIHHRIGSSSNIKISSIFRYLEQRDPNDPPSSDYSHDLVEPTVVQKVDPRYPESALAAGLEGNVLVKVWVDTSGYVRKVVVLKSDHEIFIASAIEAAKQWIFTPAYMLGKTVSVWASIPFRYRVTR